MSKTTPFIDFARLCEHLRSTPGKLEKTSILAEFLSSLDETDLKLSTLFILGKAFPDHDPRTLDVSWRTLQAQIPRSSNDSPVLTIQEVAQTFAKIAATSGRGSRQRIKILLDALLDQSTELERKYLVRIIFGEMRIGVAEGILLEGIAKAASVQLRLVRRANMYLGDPGEVAGIAFLGGTVKLEQIDLQLFRPVQPMLAGLAENFSKVLKEHRGVTSLEFKFDGARVQIHKSNERIKIYSRHLTDVTESLPDLVEIIERQMIAASAIVEGEVLAVSANGRPLPFQELMRRFRRVHDIDTARKEVPIKLYLFDLLYCNGEPFVEAPYEERLRQLEANCKAEILVTRLVTEDEGEAEGFLQEALDQGHEGLMAKKLDSAYVPGTRGKRWFKIKPAETLDLVVIAADWGSGRRVGWLSNYHLAARDPESGEFLDLGKTFKGLTDKQFDWMTQRLASLKVRETNYTVFVKPEVVVEVAYNEIQRSPHYNSKLALRFARIKRIREDKTPLQVDTIERVRDLFEKQFERKGRGAAVVTLTFFKKISV